MLILLRILLYVQVVLGLGRFAGLIRDEAVWRAHLGLGFVIAALALVALRPRPQAAAPGLRAAARLAPLVPLATGLAIFTEALDHPAMTLLHVLLGLATVGLIEAAAAREGGSGPAGPTPRPADAPGDR